MFNKKDDFVIKVVFCGDSIQLFYIYGDEVEIENSPISQCSISAKLNQNKHI